MKSSVLTTKGWALLIVAAVLVAAGTLNFAGTALEPRVSALLENVWRQLVR